MPSKSPRESKSLKKDWIKAGQAAHKLGITLRNPASAKEILAGYLRDGYLRARAGMIFVSEGERLGLAWKNEPAFESDDEPLPLQAAKWQASRRWLGDQADWRWPKNRLSITFRLKPAKRYMMRRVEFSLIDLAKLQPETFNPRAGVGGNPGKLASRDAFWQAVVRLAKDQRLDQTNFPTQQSLIDEIREIAGPTYEKDVMAKLVQQVWKKFMV